MNDHNERRLARERRARAGALRMTWRRWFATALVIGGLLLVAVGTVLAYSEWQAQADPPSSFGPDARVLKPPSGAEPVEEFAPELSAEGAELPPLEMAPLPAPRATDARLALPIMRRDADGGVSGTAEASGGSHDIPRVPAWVDSTFSGTLAQRAAPPTASPAVPYPPAASTPVPTATPIPKPTATPTATPYPVASGPPTHIEIPKIGVNADVVPVGWREAEYGSQVVRVWNVADYAAGWHETSHYPGQQGNIVISGHNNIRGEVFRDVVNLEAGDEIILTADGLRFVYVVESKMVIPEKGRPMEERLENNRWIGYSEDERLTLVTCWPYTSNTHRVIVVARPRH